METPSLRSQNHPSTSPTINPTHDSAMNILNPEVQHIYELMVKLSQSGNILIGHQTMADIAEKIMANHEYFSHTGLNGTSVVMNPNMIARFSYQQSIKVSDNGVVIHRGSDALVIIALSRQDFPTARNTVDVDETLGEFIDDGYVTQYGIPPQCVYGYITGNTLHLNQTWTGKIKHTSEYA